MCFATVIAPVITFSLYIFFHIIMCHYTLYCDINKIHPNRLVIYIIIYIYIYIICGTCVLIYYDFCYVVFPA